MPKRLTAHFTLDELVASQTAARKRIDNTPSAEVIQNLRRLAGTLEQVRALLGDTTILVSSGYRSPPLNAAISGSLNSAHMLGLAADFTAPAFGTVLQTARKIASSGIVFDQLIHEYGLWVHIGLAPDGGTPRSQKLSIFKGSRYLPGIVSKSAWV